VESPNLLVETFETVGLPVTPEIRQFRQSWLGEK